MSGERGRCLQRHDDLDQALGAARPAHPHRDAVVHLAAVLATATTALEVDLLRVAAAAARTGARIGVGRLGAVHAGRAGVAGGTAQALDHIGHGVAGTVGAELERFAVERGAPEVGPALAAAGVLPRGQVSVGGLVAGQHGAADRGGTGAGRAAGALAVVVLQPGDGGLHAFVGRV